MMTNEGLQREGPETCVWAQSLVYGPDDESIRNALVLLG
jgi:hypothetical protein